MTEKYLEREDPVTWLNDLSKSLAEKRADIINISYSPRLQKKNFSEIINEKEFKENILEELNDLGLNLESEVKIRLKERYEEDCFVKTDNGFIIPSGVATTEGINLNIPKELDEISENYRKLDALLAEIDLPNGFKKDTINWYRREERDEAIGQIREELRKRLLSLKASLKEVLKSYEGIAEQSSWWGDERRKLNEYIKKITSKASKIFELENILKCIQDEKVFEKGMKDLKKNCIHEIIHQIHENGKINKKYLSVREEIISKYNGKNIPLEVIKQYLDSLSLFWLYTEGVAYAVSGIIENGGLSKLRKDKNLKQKVVDYAVKHLEPYREIWKSWLQERVSDLEEVIINFGYKSLDEYIDKLQENAKKVVNTMADIFLYGKPSHIRRAMKVGSVEDLETLAKASLNRR